MGGDYLKYQPLVAGRGCSLADIRLCPLVLLIFLKKLITIFFSHSTGA